jgi:mono/diheme cytochrome c family protein
MKKFLKILGIIVGVIILLIVIAGLTINIKGIPTYDTQEIKLKVEMDSASIANGEKLTTLVCINCHRGKNTTVLEGNKIEDLDPSFGKAWAPNITNHPEQGLGRYTDGEIAFLLRTGIKKNGQYSPPWMPKFPNMADEEIEDIIAFLRSDHPSLQASETVQPPAEPSFLTKFLCNVEFKPFPMPEQSIERPAANDQIALGEYLANGVLHCYACHSADFKTNDDYIPMNSIGLYGGGNKLTDLDGNTILSVNITSDKNTGIGNWTEDEFVQAVKFGKRPDGSTIIFPMPKYSLLDDDEVKAIFAYLKTVPAIENDVKNSAK